MNEETNEIDYTQYVPQVKFELIPIKNLVSNQDYQRNVSVKHVHKAAKNFDLCQINPVKVSRREGIEYSLAKAPPIRQTGNHLSGRAGTA